MLMEQARGSRRLQAPQVDGQTLIEPSLVSLPEVVARNRQQLSQAKYDVQGRSLGELSAAARHTLVDRAISYTSQYREVSQRVRDIASLPDVPLLFSGHQPQLFHPGVWFKNFVLGALAKQMDAVGIHVLIDSDLCRSVSSRVPTGSVEEPRVEAVPYDEPAAEVPYEERIIRSDATFESFAKRVTPLIRPLVREPLIESLWPLTLDRNPRQTNLGLRLAQGRHALEATWQNETLELPQSAVCQLPEFAWFTAHVLAHLPRFWVAHNEALAVYRHSQRTRNRAHPVPDLAESQGWLESPFWIWSSEDPQRRPLFARQSGDDLVITDRHSLTIHLALAADRDAATAADQLMELASRGIKIRTRALTTTLFARLVLSDLFLHGIGGAKYDQVTDLIAESFFGFPLPEFAAVSATLRLPIAYDHREPFRDHSCQQQLRELRYHPERFIESNRTAAQNVLSDPGQIINTKYRWVHAIRTTHNARERHLAIEAANKALQPFVVDARRRLERDCKETQHRKRIDAILQSRDYSFCLYPQAHFESRLLKDLRPLLKL